MTTERENPFHWGPFVQVATFCEKVLREADGVISLIRIVDQVNHVARGPAAPVDMPEVRYPLTLVLTLKSGRARGRHEITIQPELPSGQTLPTATMSVQLEGTGKGVNVVSPVDIPYKLQGLYWFSIRFDGAIITRVPLEVRYSRLVAGSSTSLQPPS